jgi:hypothetical protein
MSELRCYFNGMDYVIASCEDDASEIGKEIRGNQCDLVESSKWKSVEDDMPIVVVEDTITGKVNNSRTASEWVKLIGRGFLTRRVSRLRVSAE